MDGSIVVIVLAVAFVMGIVAGNLSNHPSTEGMFWLGFFLGPIGILIAVVAGIGHPLKPPLQPLPPPPPEPVRRRHPVIKPPMSEVR
jgi:hypothetical protein